MPLASRSHQPVLCVSCPGGGGVILGKVTLKLKNISNSQELECLKCLGHHSPLLVFQLFHTTVSVTSGSMILADFLSRGDL